MMNWWDANAWANSLVVNGVAGWRLPTMVDTGAPGCDFGVNGTDSVFNVQTATSEMAHLWYVALGNKAFPDTAGTFPQPGWGLTNTGDFQNLQTFPGFEIGYWYALQSAVDSASAWNFNIAQGLESGVGYKWGVLSALAVRPGDVAVVPEPQTYALLLAGLTALVAVRRRPG